MARKVRDRELDSRDARSRLQPRGKPYFRTIERGLHVGYRRLKGKPGTWWARHYVGSGAYQIECLGPADDFSDADGTAILDFWQAQTKARTRMVARAQNAAGIKGPLTIADAVLDYLDFLDVNRRSGLDARYRAAAFILPQLGRLSCTSLTADSLRKWLAALVREPPRKRTKRGSRQQYKFTIAGPDYLRRRRASANRVLTILKAAINRAWREGHIASDVAWRRVEPFENVDAARVRYLTVAECRQLIEASDSEFRPLVEAALQTGARYGELARLEVQDFDRRAGTLLIRQSKGGKSRHIVLTEEGIALFARLCRDRRPEALIFTKSTRVPWGMSHQGKPMRESCLRAGINPPINFHGLRHSWASLAVMNGMPLLVVAKNLGHSDTRMVEKHYGHLAPSYIADAIRAGAPRFYRGPRPAKPKAVQLR